MNLKEGFRRLSLVAGVAGFAFGIYASSGFVVALYDEISEYRKYQSEIEKASIRDVIASVVRMEKLEKEANRFEIRDYPGTKAVSVKRNGVQQITFDDDYQEIKWIVLNNGNTIYSQKKPEYWTMLLFIMLPPLLGFVVPWGAVRTIGWIVQGFNRSSPFAA